MPARERSLTEYEAYIAGLTGEQRLQMVADLYATACQLLRAGILAREPQATEADVRKRIFLRFYEHEVPKALADSVLRDIDERYGHLPAER